MPRTGLFQGAVFSMSRTYSRDIFGRQVLVGLTYAETREFKLLDAAPPIDKDGRLLPWETEDKSFPPSQSRWLELYKKHQAACIRQDGD